MLFLTYCTQCCNEHGAARVFSQKCRHSSWYISRSGTAVSYSSYVFNFWGNIYAIFHRGCINLVFHQQYTGFPFLHILTSTYYLLSFWYEPFWQVWGDMLSWFWFAFPWWLVMLSIFSCTCWPSIYLHWKNVYSTPQPIFKLDCLLLNCMRSLYILDINTLADTWFANVLADTWFFPMWQVILSFC